MSLYKRKDGTYYIDIFVGKRRVRKTTGTKDRQKAQELHDKIANKRWEVEKLGAKQERSWQESVVRYLNESSHKRSLKDDITHLRFIYKYWENYSLKHIDKDAVDDIIQKRFETNVSKTTVNLMLAVIRAILRKAQMEWEWVDKIPHIKLLPNNNSRMRWLTVDEAMRLLQELPTHLRDMAAFTLSTGLRASNVRLLKWSQIDMDRKHAYITSSESKTKKAIPVPLNIDAMDIILRQSRVNEHVFNYNGTYVSQLSTKAFRKALKRAGIDNFRWHDLRHTWASWHVQNGTSLQALQQLGGWTSFEMVLRYAHLSSEHLQADANRISVTSMAHSSLRIVKNEG